MKTLVVFKATWCGPCKQLDMTLNEVDLGIPVTKVDIDNDPLITTEFAVRGVPTLVLIEDNEVRKRTTGAMTKQQLLDFVNN